MLHNLFTKYLHELRNWIYLQLVRAGLGEGVRIHRGKNLKQKDKNILALLGNDIPRVKCNKVKQNITQRDHSFELKPKNKIQEMLLLSRSASASPGTPK